MNIQNNCSHDSIINEEAYIYRSKEVKNKWQETLMLKILS